MMMALCGPIINNGYNKPDYSDLNEIISLSFQWSPWQ